MPFELKTQFECIECAKCALPFAITTRFMELRKRDHKSFVCPSGHKNFFLSTTDLEFAEQRIAVLVARVASLTEANEYLRNAGNRDNLLTDGAGGALQ